jgi:hypothetical protein
VDVDQPWEHLRHVGLQRGGVQEKGLLSSLHMEHHHPDQIE